MANFLLSIAVKNFENRLVFGKVMERVWCHVFLTCGVHVGYVQETFSFLLVKCIQKTDIMITNWQPAFYSQIDLNPYVQPKMNVLDDIKHKNIFCIKNQ